MKILNIGSINLDKSYHVEQFITAGKTSRVLEHQVSFGGKGMNQSVAIARAGAPVWHAGVVGDDGAEITQFMQSEGVQVDYLVTAEGATGHAIIQIDRTGQNCILICPGTNNAVSKAFVDNVLSKFARDDFLVLQNEISNVDYAILRAHEIGMKIFLNPSPIETSHDIPNIELVDYLILNEVEGRILTGEHTDQSMLAALHQRFPRSAIVLTLGEKGVLYQDSRQFLACNAYPTQVKDTTAAGDTFEGYFIASLYEGLTVERALRRASKAASVCVSRQGAALSIPYRKEVDS